MKFQGASGLVDEATISQIGNLTGADFIILGTISNFGNKIYSVDARIIDVQTGKSIRSAQYNSKDIINLLENGMSDIALELTGLQISKGKNKKQEDGFNIQLIPTYTVFKK